MDTGQPSAIRWQTAPKSLRAPTTSSSVKKPKWDLSSEICKLKDRNSELYEETPQIERDYAASLRKLIRNYTPKKNAKDQETTQKTEFRFKIEILLTSDQLLILFDRLLLEEIGFLAGQHEMIDTAYGKEAFDP